MWGRIKQIRQSHTVRQSIITSLSSFIASGLGAIFYLIIARVLGTQDYGLFSLTISTLLVGVSIADLGMGQSLVKFVGANRERNMYYPYVNISWQTKLITGSLATLLFAFLSSLIANLIFHQPRLSNLLPFTGLGIFFLLLYSLSSAIFQGQQKFFQWGGLQVGANLLRLIFFGIFLLISRTSPTWALISFCLSYLAAFLISLKWLDLGWLKTTITPKLKHDFWAFNRWTAAFTILVSITSRLDVIITGRFLTLNEVGIYSLAVSMSALLPQLVTAIGAVTAAKFAGIKDTAHEKIYLRKVTLFVLGISLLVALLMLPVGYLVIRLVGVTYSSSWNPFLVLLTSLVVYSLTNPIRDSLLYYHTKPQFFFWMTVGQGLVILTFGVLLVPPFRIMGAAVTVLISQLFVSLCSLVYYRSLAKQQ